MKITQKLASFVFPPPCSNGKPSDSKRTDLPANQVNNNSETPSRCQFTFSDGRQCRSQRAQFCAHHSSREGAKGRGNGFPDEDLAGLCGDLTTATNINRALAHVFLLTAQGRIPQKQAVAFGYLSQLLLQTIPGIRSEYVSAHGYQSWQNNLKSKITSLPPTPLPEPSFGGQHEHGNSVVILSEPSSGERLPTGCAFAAQQSQRERSAQFASRSGLREISPNSSSESAADPASPGQSIAETKATPPTPPSPDYAGIFRRSLNLLDRKYDTTPEGRREAKALMRELEVVNSIPAKPRKQAPRSRPTPPSPPEPDLCSSGRPAVACLLGEGGRPEAFSPSATAPSTAASVSPTTARPNERDVHFVSPACPESRSVYYACRESRGEPRTASMAAEPQSPHRREKRKAPTLSNWTAQSIDWYTPASWSRPRPDPFPSRQEKLNRKRRTMSDRRRQHQMQSRAFWH